MVKNGKTRKIQIKNFYFLLFFLRFPQRISFFFLIYIKICVQLIFITGQKTLKCKEQQIERERERWKEKQDEESDQQKKQDN